MDDFGVGYSSMSQLLGLAIDELKIDKSFVLELGSDQRAKAIVRSAVELARALGLTVVAEGIECEETLLSLANIGANVGQGYVIAYPLTAEQLDAYLARPDQARSLFAGQGVANSAQAPPKARATADLGRAPGCQPPACDAFGGGDVLPAFPIGE